MNRVERQELVLENPPLVRYLVAEESATLIVDILSAGRITRNAAALPYEAAV